MVVLELSALPVGRFEVHDDLTITEVLFTPDIDQPMVDTMVAMLQAKHTPFGPILDAVKAMLASLWKIDAGDVVVWVDAEPEWFPEPDMSE